MIDAKLKRTALLVAGCFFMENLDGTIVTTATPAISTSLGESTTAVSLVVTAYLIALAVLIPLSGWAMKRFGARPVFLAAIVIFTLASLGCAISQTLPMLVGMRILQGVGGAMMVPVGRMVVLSQTDKEDLIRVTAYIIWPGLIAPVIAPLLGGLITDYASWHWMFLINIPIGIIAFLVAMRLIDDTPGESTVPLDWLGVLLTCSALGGLTWGAHVVAESAGDMSGGAMVIAGSLIILAIAVWHLLRDDAPLLNLHTLSVHTFRSATAGFFFFAMAVWSMPFILPLLFQQVFGWTAVQSGWAVLWVFAGNISIKPATTWLLNRFGFKANMLVATTGVAISIAAFALLGRNTPFPLIAALAFISGVFRSVGFTSYNTIAFSDVPKGNQMREANALYATAQQVAGGLGIVLTVLALRAGEAWGGFLPGDALQQEFRMAFLLMGVFCLIPTLIASRLHPQAGDALRSS